MEVDGGHLHAASVCHPCVQMLQVHMDPAAFLSYMV